MKNVRVIAFLFAFAASGAVFASGVDGLVEPGEYASSHIFTKGNFTLHWRFDGETVVMAIETDSAGWVSVGFDPGAVMAKSDLILGLVNPDGTTQALDTWSTGMFGPHPDDTKQGGTYDILEAAGSRDEKRVVFEFSRRLDTGDRFDKVLAPGKTMKVLWATGPNLSATAKHDRKGSATLTF